MDFEPVNPAGNEPMVHTGSNLFEPLKSNRKTASYVRTLTGNLTVIRSITARTGKPGFACAVTLKKATAIINVQLTQDWRGQMNLRKRSKRKIHIPRVSIHIHLWPELELMPPLDHWPNRPGIYRPQESQVLQFFVDGFGVTLDDAEKIFGSARKKGVIRYDKKTRLWCGRKGGRP